MITPVSNNLIRTHINFAANQAPKQTANVSAPVYKKNDEPDAKEIDMLNKEYAAAFELHNSVVERRNSILDTAYEVFEASRFGEMLNYAGEMDNEDIAVIHDEDGKDTVIFTNEEGNITGKSYYTNGRIKLIEKYDEDGSKTTYDIGKHPAKNKKDFTLSVTKRRYENSHGPNTQSTFDVIVREGKLAVYANETNFYLNSVNVQKGYENRLYFSRFDSRPIRYEEGFTLFKNGDMKISRVLKENSFYRNYTQFADGSEEADNIIIFNPKKREPRQVLQFIKGYKTDANGTRTVENEMFFDESGNLKKLRNNFVTTSTGRYISGEEFTLVEDIWLNTTPKIRYS